MPENQRNNFPNPREHLHSSIRFTESVIEEVKLNNDRTFGRYGKVVLITLRRLKSKITVRTLLSILKREVHAEISEDFILATVKFLANDGFVKLGDAEQFETRKILKYHATAEPEFRSGKFQL